MAFYDIAIAWPADRRAVTLYSLACGTGGEIAEVLTTQPHACLQLWQQLSDCTEGGGLCSRTIVRLKVTKLYRRFEDQVSIGQTSKP